MSTAFKLAEYYAFTRFIATPKPFRDLKTQLEFQVEYNVSHETLAQWKKDPNFWEDVARAMKVWGREQTPNVIAAIYQRILRVGDPVAAELWLKFIEDYKEPRGNVNIQVNQTIIQLPEERKTMILQAFENYGLLKKQNEPSEINLPSSGGDSERSSPAETGG